MKRKLGPRQLEELKRFGRDPQSDWDYAAKYFCSCDPKDWGDWHSLYKKPWPILRSLQRRGLLDLRVEQRKCGNSSVVSMLQWQARTNDAGREVLERI